MINEESIKANLHAIIDHCHNNSRNAGWWDDRATGIDLSKDNPLTFPTKAMLIVTELAEAIEGDRKGVMDDKIPEFTMVEAEMADAFIRWCDVCGGFNLRVVDAIIAKLAFNTVREDHKIENRVKPGGKKY